MLSDEEWRSVDRAIDLGLGFLASQQDPEGAFATDIHGQPGVSSLCALAFLSRGRVPGRGPDGETLGRALRFAAGAQQPNGLLSSVGPPGMLVRMKMNGKVGVAAVYNHAIAGLALSEAYALGAGGVDAQLEPVIRRAVGVSLDLQRWPKGRPEDVGGWRYLTPHDGVHADLSVVGWHLMFLRSAKNAGFEVPETAINDAVDFVLRCYNPELGVFEYSVEPRDRRSRAMAAAGILALAHSGMHHRPEAVSSADFLLRHDFGDYNRAVEFTDYASTDRYHYGVFYACQAMYQVGGERWERFFPPTAKTLVANQNGDGSWAPEGDHDAAYGPVYTTALAVLALNAPSQLLPIFQR